MNDSFLRRLCLTQPDGFVAERNSIVKQLKAGGDREGATAIAGLRRPSWTDWALNQVADADHELVAGFGESAAAVAAAQQVAIAGWRAVDLRTPLQQLRQRSAEVTKRTSEVLVAAGRAPDLGELAARIAWLAADTDAARSLQSATLITPTGDTEPPLPGGPGSESDHEPEPATKPKAKLRRNAAPEPEPERPKPAEQSSKRRRLEDELQAAIDAQRSAAQALTEIDGVVDAGREAVEAAKRQLLDARERLHAAERRRDPIAQRAATAAKAVERAERSLARETDRG